MRRAQASSVIVCDGRHTKILRRLDVSDTPVTVYGPVMLKSRTCGSAVKPTLSPYSVSDSVYSIGAIRSSTTPSNF